MGSKIEEIDIGKEVNIIGKGPGWDLAPKQNENKEKALWGVNELIVSKRDLSLIFDMHDHRKHFEISKWKRAVEIINELQVPFISVMGYPQIPTSESYPIEEISKAFDTDYFTNTIDYMLAYAIWEGATVINMYGVDMMVSSEYAYEKPGVEFWVGFAKGRGIKVNNFGRHSTILKSKEGKVYGYLTWQKEVQKMREELIKLEKEGKLSSAELYLYEFYVLESIPEGNLKQFKERSLTME